MRNSEFDWLGSCSQPCDQDSLHRLISALA